jgi:hypothetical protein
VPSPAERLFGELSKEERAGLERITGRSPGTMQVEGEAAVPEPSPAEPAPSAAPAAPVIETLEQAQGRIQALEEELRKAQFTAEKRKKRVRQLRDEHDQLRRAFVYQDERLRALESRPGGASAPETQVPGVPARRVEALLPLPPELREGIPIDQDERGNMRIPPAVASRLISYVGENARATTGQLQAAQQQRQQLMQRLTEGIPVDVAQRLAGAWTWLSQRFDGVLEEGGPIPSTPLETVELIESSGLAEEFAKAHPEIELDDVLDLGMAYEQPQIHGRSLRRVLGKYTKKWSAPAASTAAPAPGAAPQGSAQGPPPATPSAPLRPHPRPLSQRSSPGPPPGLKPLDEIINRPLQGPGGLLSMSKSEYEKLRDATLAEMRRPAR